MRDMCRLHFFFNVNSQLHIKLIKENKRKEKYKLQVKTKLTFTGFGVWTLPIIQWSMISTILSDFRLEDVAFEPNVCIISLNPAAVL